MTHIIEYIKELKLPTEGREARKIQQKTAYYSIIGINETKVWKHGATWEEPYCIISLRNPGVYRLADMNGKEERDSWNVMYLKKYYV